MNKKPFICLGLLFAICVLGFMGQAQRVYAIVQKEIEQQNIKESGNQQNFVMGPEDVIEISVWGNKAFSGALPVRPDGNISIPLVGDVKVAGLTPAELKDLITTKLRKFITDASVTVLVKEINSINISIAGEVTLPGTYKVNRPITLLHLFSLSQGFGEKADLKNSFLLRKGKKLNIDIYALVKNGDISHNVWLEPNDLIFIKDNYENRIKVIGEVEEPQIITFHEGMTVLDAVLVAKGLTNVAKPSGTKVYRRNTEQNGEIEKIPVSLDDVIFEGDLTKNVLLKRGDIIHVPRSFF